jgi:AcrR family transcriptional regulator
MKTPRIDIARIRREQIVEAAASVIAEKGLQRLSLSEIEKKVGLSRGQLTYYFKAKEDILLAVFDRLLLLMCRQHGGDPDMKVQDHPYYRLPWLDIFAMLLDTLMRQPPQNPEFHALQYTFLSQVGHRADFRERLAKLYEEWRSNGSRHLSRDLTDHPPARAISPRAMASLTQAILHGLVMQSVVDPEAFDPKEVADLCLDMIRNYLWPAADTAYPAAKKPSLRTNKRNGAARPGARLLANGVKHERK